jgi:hypothetical protein
MSDERQVDWGLGEQESDGDPFVPRNRTVEEMMEVENANGGFNPDPLLPRMLRFVGVKILPLLRAIFC